MFEKFHLKFQIDFVFDDVTISILSLSLLMPKAMMFYFRVNLQRFTNLFPFVTSFQNLELMLRIIFSLQLQNMSQI